MTLYTTILFIHLLATLGLVAAISVEAIELRQLRRAAEISNVQSWLDAMPDLRIFASTCLLILFFSGGYLTDRLSMWQLAWPKVAVVIVLTFGALAGVSSRRLRQIRKALRNAVTADSILLSRVRAPFFNISLSLRTGLVLAAVFLMIVKPNLMQSLSVVFAFLLIFLGVGSLGAKSQEPGIRMDTRPVHATDTETGGFSGRR